LSDLRLDEESDDETDGTLLIHGKIEALELDPESLFSFLNSFKA
jgi:hypothetical protein